MNVTGSMRGLSVLVFVIGAILAGCSGDRFYFDENGFPHGTGEEVYRYESGEVMLREQYVDGRLEHSRWHRPDGALVQETDWVDETGEGIYLREDGSIRRRMQYVNGTAEGLAIDYDEEGNVTKTVLYEAGQPAGSEKQRAEGPVAEPAVPDHPLRERFIGQWQSEGETVLVIAGHPDGGVVIRSAEAASWVSVINNVRFEGDVLRYDQYLYFDEMPGHPYSGMCNEVTLTLTDDPDRLKQAVHTSNLPEPVEGALVRAPAGSRTQVRDVRDE